MTFRLAHLNLPLRCTLFIALVHSIFLGNVSAEDGSPMVRESRWKRAVAISDTKPAPDYLSLHDCLRIALEQNFDIQRSRLAIERQAAELMASRAFSLPHIAASASLDRQDKDKLPSFNGQTFGSYRSWGSNIELEQTLFRGGEGIAKWRRDRILKDAAVFGHLAAINQVLYSVHERFYDALLARATLKVQEQNVSLSKEELAVEKNKLEAGTVSQFNVLRAEVNLANAQTPLIRARDDLRLALDELHRVLGTPEQTQSPDTPPLKIYGRLTEPEINLPLDKVVELSRENRPEIQQLELIQEARRWGIDIERAAFFPTLSAYLGYGWDSSRFGNNLSNIDQGWTTGLRASWKLFDSFETVGNVRAARADRKIAKVDLLDERRSIEIEARRSYSHLREARDLVRASRKVVEQAVESLRLARSRFDVGAGDQLEILDTQVALTEARTNQAQSLRELNIAAAEIARATASQLTWVAVGDDWRPSMATLPAPSDQDGQ